jgi:single-stranded-DNA-specific exonuclease
MANSHWQISLPEEIPPNFLKTIQNYCAKSSGKHAAQLFWKRGIRNIEKLASFIDPKFYQPTSPFAFGQEMKWAMNRLKKALELGEKVAIWGDFDADGITATSVLWEGLGQFFIPNLQLTYYIPNRLIESHGLNIAQLEKLAVTGTKLIITCDTGSTNLKEIKYAKELGIDLIITDHHTLPEDRPDVVAMINPRYFAENHPLYHLSGVAVAYKLVEALYQTLPDIPQQPVDNLLDLVVIGLIADLVQLSGDCRYLAQKGIQKLQLQTSNPTRHGIANLLKFCQRSGDRPTDISFGIGPRINAISRIHGDAHFAVELLTSRDQERCQKLAMETELANTRRKALQKTVTSEIKKKLATLDLSTTSVIVLVDDQWPNGILGLVAGQIAQEYGRPTVLLTTRHHDLQSHPLARGSARSLNNIDLYQLMKSQEHLLESFGGHPFAAGLSLRVENIPVFQEAINQQFWQYNPDKSSLKATIKIDLVVKVAELGKSLFQEMKLLEPCGMGNPTPKLLIKNCYFKNPWHNKPTDFRGKKIEYIKTTFELMDETVTIGFPGVWWGHYKEETPVDQACDVVVELDYNPHQDRYEVRLIDFKISNNTLIQNNLNVSIQLIDWRNQDIKQTKHTLEEKYQTLEQCPTDWQDLQTAYHQATQDQEKLALAYSAFPETGIETLKKLIGIAKYLSRTQLIIPVEQLKNQLELSNQSLTLGLQILSETGFEIIGYDESLAFNLINQIKPIDNIKIQLFCDALEEEKFQRQYFCKVPLTTLKNMLQ